MSDITPDQLTTREEFFAFIQSLRWDLATDEHVANTTLDSFLESLGAWAQNSNQNGLPESWQLAAKLLRAGLYYE